VRLSPLARQIRIPVVSLTPTILGERARAPVRRSFGRGLRHQGHDLSSLDSIGLAVFMTRSLVCTKSVAMAKPIGSINSEALHLVSDESIRPEV
jgi:hypothetical protein